MTKNLKIGILVLFIFQLLIASGFELAHDEAYYWLFSQRLDWGYFDHPPMVAVIIRLFSFLPHSELTVRFGSVLLQFGTLYLIFKMLPEDRKKDATLLYFAFPLASFSGLLALPDMPLLFMTAVYCFLLKKYLEKDDVKTTLLLGLAISLLLYSKYHGILLVFFTLVAVPQLFKTRNFYLVTATALITFLPHVVWQYQHDFGTIRYHFLERPGSSFSFLRSLEFVGLQVVLAGVLAGPWLWWRTLKAPMTDSFEKAMKFISIGTVVFFLISSFSKRVEANWTIYLVVPLIYLSLKDKWDSKIFSKMLWVSFILVMGARLLFVIPGIKGPRRLAEFQGWQSWALEVRDRCGEDSLLANSYQIASKLSFYLNQPVHALNYHSRKNQFDIWGPNEDYYSTEKVCYVTDKKAFEGEIFSSPEGKKLRIVRDRTLNELLTLKSLQ